MSEPIRSGNVRAGCYDHGCVIETPTGMGTNGGCRCPKWKLQREIHLLRQERDSLIKETQ